MKKKFCLPSIAALAGTVHAGLFDRNAIRTRQLLFSLLLAFSALSAQPLMGETTASDRIRAALLDPEEKRMFIVAHRGDWREFPENSLPAIESCIARGLPIVEVDLQRTKDGHFVLMHDRSVDRTTTGRGRVNDLTLEEIRELRLLNGIGRPTQWKVPTLEEALAVIHGEVLINLDKSFDYFREMYPILVESGTAAQIIMKPGSNTPVQEAMDATDGLLDEVLFMPLVNLSRRGGMEIAREYLKEMNPFAMEIVYREWRPEFEEIFRECVENGTRIWINTLWERLAGDLTDNRALEEPDAVYGWLLDQGVTMIQSDRPFALQRYLESRGMNYSVAASKDSLEEARP